MEQFISNYLYIHIYIYTGNIYIDIYIYISEME